MSPIKRILSSACLAASLFVLAAGSGCAARVRYYDEYHGDYHNWNHNEDLAYRRYWNDRHEQYHDYKNLNKDDQKRYWDWRHEHPDNH